MVQRTCTWITVGGMQNRVVICGGGGDDLSGQI
jgi:hypothetical protein